MTKRALLLGTIALLALALVGPDIASAKPPADHGPGAFHPTAPALGGKPCPTPTATPAPTATATATATPTPTPTPGATATPTASPTAPPRHAASFIARVTPGHVCGTIHVLAMVLHPDRSSAFTAIAVAHFSTGDVTVTLRRAGKSFVAVGKVPVPAGQAAGRVTIDVAITNGTATRTIILSSRISKP